MGLKAKSSVKIYDPETGKTVRLDALIMKLGLEAVARKYRVTRSAVQKWRFRIHKPALRTLDKSSKKLF